MLVSNFVTEQAYAQATQPSDRQPVTASGAPDTDTGLTDIVVTAQRLHLQVPMATEATMH